MHKSRYFLPKLHGSTIPALFLLTNWFAGLSLGFLAARFYGGMLASLALQSAAVRGSLTGTLAAAMFPLFFSACAVFLFDSRSLFPLCLGRGFTLGLMLGAVSASCAGGMLLGLLLLFSALLSSPVLIWYWLRRLCGMGDFRKDTLHALVLIFAIWAVDRLLIAPFLAYAITF